MRAKLYELDSLPTDAEYRALGFVSASVTPLPVALGRIKGIATGEVRKPSEGEWVVGVHGVKRACGGELSRCNYIATLVVVKQFTKFMVQQALDHDSACRYINNQADLDVQDQVSRINM